MRLALLARGGHLDFVGEHRLLLRRDVQRWFEVEIAADYDYNEEARSRYAEKHPNMSREDIDANMKGDIPERIPKDGYYNFKTNSNANPNQSWYISGAIKIGRPLSEAEARRISREMGVEEDLPYKDGVKDFDEDDFNPDGSGGGKSVDSVVAEAEQMTETNPTDGQKEAGNYKKGHVKVYDFDVTIEQPKGSVRSGVDADGKEWSQEMHNTYGYIRGTEGVDGDHIDVFLSDHLDDWNQLVFVVDQVNKDGSFDEHKVMIGFNSTKEAQEAYLSNYEDGWTGLGNITVINYFDFKDWINSSHRKTKPFAEYKIALEKAILEEESAQNESRTIQGLDGYTEQDVLDGVRGDIEAKLEEADVDDVTIKGMALHGSRMRGDARDDSDLDVVIEYEGNWSEDSLFDLLNEEPVYFDGVKVDINPITRGKSGTLEQYMERSRRYDEEKTAPVAENEMQPVEVEQPAVEPVQSTGTSPAVTAESASRRRPLLSRLPAARVRSISPPGRNAPCPPVSCRTSSAARAAFRSLSQSPPRVR